MFRIVRNKNIIAAVNDINDDLIQIRRWSQQWLVEVSTDKSVSMIISKKPVPSQPIPIMYGNIALQHVTHHKHLGVWFDSKLSWSYHIDQVCASASKRLNMMLPLKHKLPRSALENIYMSFVRPLIEYADVIFDNCTIRAKTQLENIQIRGAQIVTGAKRHTSHTYLYRETGWSTLTQRRLIHKLKLLHQIIHGSVPDYLTHLLPTIQNVRVTRQANNNTIQQFRSKTDYFQKSFFPSTINIWNNSLNFNTRKLVIISTFKRTISRQFMTQPLTQQQRTIRYSGPRTMQITMAQMRMGFSNLNHDLYQKNCVDSPVCHCAQSNEDLTHYFMSCTSYT